MTLGDLVNKPLKEVIEEMDLVEFKPHTDGLGHVQALEIKYRPKDIPVAPAKKESPWR